MSIPPYDKHDWLEYSDAGYIPPYMPTFFVLQKAYAVGGEAERMQPV